MSVLTIIVNSYRSLFPNKTEDAAKQRKAAIIGSNWKILLLKYFQNK